MKRNLYLVLIMMFSSIGFSEDSKGDESKVICLVSGEVIEGDYKEESAKYKEGEVYFCCGGCKMDFEEDASKFSTAANFQLLATKQYSETNVCPVTGRKIKSKKEVIVQGLSVGVCCAGCVKKINQSNNKVSMLFSDSALDKGFAKSKPKSNKK